MFGREKFLCPRRTEVLGGMSIEGKSVDYWHKGKCSYCGSIRPEDFLDRLEKGDVLGTTTKNYKAYLNSNHDKFYYKHLDEDQQKRFIELYNDGTIVVDFPQYFMVPFFAAEDPSGRSRGSEVIDVSNKSE